MESSPFHFGNINHVSQAPRGDQISEIRWLETAAQSHANFREIRARGSGEKNALDGFFADVRKKQLVQNFSQVGQSICSPAYSENMTEQFCSAEFCVANRGNDIVKNSAQCMA